MDFFSQNLSSLLKNTLTIIALKLLISFLAVVLLIIRKISRILVKLQAYF